MGQVLPLPERIPRPNPNTDEGKKIIKAFNKFGIEFEDTQELYITYKLPNGWRTIDDSRREDLPQYYIVDDTNMVQFFIGGSWKGTYDNNLYMEQVDFPYTFESKNKTAPLIPSETSNTVVMGKMCEAIDSLHRPANPHTAQRKLDYTTKSSSESDSDAISDYD
jgi:hypothetical protein